MKQSDIVVGGIYTTLSQTERRWVTGITFDSVLVPAGSPEPDEHWAKLDDVQNNRPIGWLVEKKGTGVVTYVRSCGITRTRFHSYCTLLGFARWAKHRCIHLRWPYGLRRYNVAQRAAEQ